VNVKSHADLPTACFIHNSNRRACRPLATAHTFRWRGRAADERSAAGGFVSVLRERAHERQINVNVRVNETGENKFAFCVNDSQFFGTENICINARDGFVFAQNVRDVARISAVTISPFLISKLITFMTGFTGLFRIQIPIL